MTLWGFCRAFVVASTIVFTGTACQKSDDTEYPFPTYESSGKVSQALEKTSLSCETTECESNKKDFESIGLVAMVVEGEPDGKHVAGQCTGFLYGSQEIVALNSHCITDSIWSKQQNCGKYLAIKFPETPGHPSEVRECQEIIYRSDLKHESVLNIDTDYAFFRIKPVSRTFLPLATSPTGDQQTITVRKVNPLKYEERIGGTLDYAYCTTQTESLLNLNFTNEWSKTGLGVKIKNSNKTCKIIQGNSGSPVINARNEIIGFAQSYATQSFVDFIKTTTFKRTLSAKANIDINIQGPTSVPEHFHYTQALCVRSPHNLGSENPTCQTSENAQRALGDQMIKDGFENARSINEYVNRLKADANANPTMFRYEVEKDPALQVYSLNPQCVLNEKKWNTASFDNSFSGLVPSRERNIRILAQPLIYKISVHATYDENFALKSKRLDHEAQSVRFTTTIKDNRISIKRGVMHRLYSFEESSSVLENVGWCLN